MRTEIPAYGVEPAANIAKVAVAKGVPTVVAFFGVSTALQLAMEGSSADLIIANNVFGHVPDINDFVARIKLLLKVGGTVSIEIPHFMRLIENNQFDTIYHEHYCYHMLLADNRLFAANGLRLFDVDKLSTHGVGVASLFCRSLRCKCLRDRGIALPLPNSIVNVRALFYQDFIA